MRLKLILAGVWKMRWFIGFVSLLAFGLMSAFRETSATSQDTSRAAALLPVLLLEVSAIIAARRRTGC